MKKFLKKTLKITAWILLLLVVGFYIFFYVATSPKSDETVLEPYKELGIKAELSYEKFKNFDYRKLSIVRDTTLPTLVFVHGTIGSVRDFERYMKDSLISTKANVLAYDRIGYNYKDKNDVQESIAFEVAMLEDIVKEIPNDNIILVGYSYGGPIALASKQIYKQVVLLAPAVYSKVEPMPAMLNFYKWRLTRGLVPPVWKQASKEKMSHPKDLENFEKTWYTSPSNVVSLHGDQDWIVPFSNSEYLAKQFPKDQFELEVVKEAGHGLIWTHFEEIRNHLLSYLD